MERLTQNQNKYLLFGVPVEVKLVYGPVVFTYEIEQDEKINEKTLIYDLVNQIKREENIDLTKFSNTYLTTGINLVTGNKTTRHEFVWFFLSKPVMN